VKNHHTTLLCLGSFETSQYNWHKCLILHRSKPTGNKVFKSWHNPTQS